jgi:uncharacterized Zn finger protein (UPF0148 family)
MELEEEYHCPDCGKVVRDDTEIRCAQCEQRKQRALREMYQAMPEEAVAREIKAIITALHDNRHTTAETDEESTARILKAHRHWNERTEDTEAEAIKEKEIRARETKGAEVSNLFRISPAAKAFMMLLGCRGISTEKIAQAALQASAFQPAALYRDAAPDVRAHLIAQLMQHDCDSHHAWDLLLCLATAGGEDVLAAFVELENHPRRWQKKLMTLPSDVAYGGGWTVSNAAQRIELCYEQCWPLFPVTDGATPADSAVSVATPRDDTCHHCGTRLMDILTLDGKDARLAFLQLAGVVKIPICPQCVTRSSRTIVHYAPDGASRMEVVPFEAAAKPPFWKRWRRKGTREDASDEDDASDATEKLSGDQYAALTAPKTFALAQQPAPLFFARANRTEALITLGGFPAWVAASNNYYCPDCNCLMYYFAGVPWDGPSEYSNSEMGTMLYFMICQDCRVIAMQYDYYDIADDLDDDD